MKFVRVQWIYRELKQRRRRRKWDVAKKNELAWILLNLIMSFRPFQIVKSGRFFLDSFLKGLYSGSKRKRRIRPHVFTFSMIRCIRKFHVVVVQWTSKKCTKKGCTCRAAVVLLIKPIAFWHFLCRRRRGGWLSSLTTTRKPPYIILRKTIFTLSTRHRDNCINYTSDKSRLKIISQEHTLN